MKCISFILILLCFCCQQQVAALTIDDNSNKDKYAPWQEKKAEGGIIKAQQGVSFDPVAYGKAEQARAYEWYRKNQQAEQEAKAQEALASGKTPDVILYGTVGIIILFIVIAVAAFYILYTRGNKDNPKYYNHEI